MIEVRSCGILLFRNDPNPSFLLMRHANRWDLPKGHVDEGETFMECALRELEEETGIQESQIKLDPDFKFIHQYTVTKKRYGNVPKLKELIIYLAELTEPVDINVTEHLGFEWFDWIPSHNIQTVTIDPLLAQVADYWAEKKSP